MPAEARREVRSGAGPAQRAREEQAGASRPLGRASTLQDNWLAGTAGKAPSWATQGIKGPLWGDLRAAPLGRGGWQFQ